MEIEGIQRLANALGIASAHPCNVKVLIQSIQREEGLMPCLSEAWSAPCSINECPFSAACSSNTGIACEDRH